MRVPSGTVTQTVLEPDAPQTPGGDESTAKLWLPHEALLCVLRWAKAETSQVSMLVGSAGVDRTAVPLPAATCPLSAWIGLAGSTPEYATMTNAHLVAALDCHW